MNTITVCKLHKKLKGQNLLETILAQNRRFNLSLGTSLTEKQAEIINIAKNVNRLRIRTENLTNFDEELPHEITEEPLTFFQNFRRILRI